MGELLEKYGTYEMNGIAFQDVNEIWWLETIGGHHFIARKVPDDSYVVMPNQFGIDAFDLEDALTEQKEHMCSADLKEFIAKHHLDLSLDGSFSARDAFGTLALEVMVSVAVMPTPDALIPCAAQMPSSSSALGTAV